MGSKLEVTFRVSLTVEVEFGHLGMGPEMPLSIGTDPSLLKAFEVEALGLAESEEPALSKDASLEIASLVEDFFFTEET